MMASRIEIVHVPPETDDQAVAQVRQILENARWKGLLRLLGQRQDLMPADCGHLSPRAQASRVVERRGASG